MPFIDRIRHTGTPDDEIDGRVGNLVQLKWQAHRAIGCRHRFGGRGCDRHEHRKDQR
jgi:hypothetical protein